MERVKNKGAGTAVPEVRPYCIFNGQPMYTFKAACLLLNMSGQTLRRYLAAKKITGQKIGRRDVAIAFYERDLNAFMAGRQA